jgi:two-component system, sensor histidine kinase and response regulator
MIAEMPSTILVAEDDPLIREVTENTLSIEGYRVVSVPDGEEALGVLSNLKPDLILSDVRMPRCDGFELLRRVRRNQEYQTTPFIIMSAKAETRDQRMGMSLGADDYVTKPFLPLDLLNTIDVRLKRAFLINKRLQSQQQFLLRVLPHELRTPLSGIIGYSDLMTMMGEAGETMAAKDLLDYGQNIGRSGQRLLSIAEDFSLWSWLEAAKSEPKAPGGASLKEAQITAEGLRHWCEKSVAEYGREQDLTIEGAVATVMVPAEGLERVFSHLVKNAMKFSLPGTSVHVKIVAYEGACEISVTDFGRGMQEADMDQLGAMRQFGREKFEQQGTGMGLGLARNFAQLAGGAFRLGNNVPGPGMTARLKLMRAAG